MAKRFDKIKSLFIVTDEVEDAKNKTEQQNTENNDKDKKNSEDTTKNQQQSQNKVTSKMSWKTSANEEVVNNNVETKVETNTDLNQQGEFSQKIFDQLSQAISDANLPGEDYIEFMEALAAMKNIQLDENIKLQTVFATLSTKGLTKAKVIESADYYLKVLENEKSKFYEVVNNHMKGQINNKISEITQLENSMKEKEEKIATLQEEIKQTKQIVMKIKNEIQQSDGKIKKTENDFQITYDAIANNIKNTVEKIKNI